MMPINDAVFKKLMTMAKSYVRTIRDDAHEHSKFIQIEALSLLNNDRVTAINGLPTNELCDISNQRLSISAVNAVIADGSQNLIQGTTFTVTDDSLFDSRFKTQVSSFGGAPLLAGSDTEFPSRDGGSPEKGISTLHIALLTIEKINTAAFQDLGANIELSSVLTGAAHRIESGTLSRFPLQDTNGNDVGSFEIVAAAPQSPPTPGTARLQFDLSQPEFQQDRAVQLSQAIHVVADQLAMADSSQLVLVDPQNGKTTGPQAVDSAPKFLFRGDTRSPSTIFDVGFEPLGGVDDLLEHAGSGKPSNYVSTSKSPNVSREDFGIVRGGEGYVYTLRYQQEGVDVNKVLGSSSPFPHELEIAVPHKIESWDIMGARTVGPEGKFVGPFISNPWFDL